MNQTMTLLYVTGAYFGAIVTIFLMQMSSRSLSEEREPPWLRQTRRITLTLLALSLLYGADYVAREIAAPWLPNVLLVWALDTVIIVRIISIIVRSPAIGRLSAAGLIKAE